MAPYTIRVDIEISIHALREEGDPRTGPGWTVIFISIHALREEGDECIIYEGTTEFLFLSTPSARRATVGHDQGHPAHYISIHALREEGDATLTLRAQIEKIFLSTPSARRATTSFAILLQAFVDFYPRPPRGGRR